MITVVLNTEVTKITKTQFCFCLISLFVYFSYIYEIIKMNSNILYLKQSHVLYIDSGILNKKLFSVVLNKL